MMGWQWHQLDHMQIISTLLQTDNHNNTSPLSFYRTAAIPAAQPTASVTLGRKIPLTQNTRNRLILLANVNSRLRLLFAVACPSVCRLSVVCNDRAPYSGSCNFRQSFYGVW